MVLESEDLITHLQGIVHRDTQEHDYHFDLTVGDVEAFNGTGALDFGGSEFRPAGTHKLDPEKQDPEDDYGWWELEGGTYRAIFNEALARPREALVFITPHSHLRQAGIVAETLIYVPGEDTGRPYMNFRVPSGGCRIKENARFASLCMVGD